LVVLWLHAPKAHQLLVADAELVAQRAKVLFNKSAMKSIVPSWHRRVGGEDGLPRDLAGWVAVAREQRTIWRRNGVAMEARKPLLLRALNAIYRTRDDARFAEDLDLDLEAAAVIPPKVPWLSGPEDSWL
jgi:hypothetical protein